MWFGELLDWVGLICMEMSLVNVILKSGLRSIGCFSDVLWVVNFYELIFMNWRCCGGGEEEVEKMRWWRRDL